MVLSFLRNVHQKVKATLDGKNLVFFLEELGLRLHEVITAHVKKFTISKGLGGMRLMRDLTEYKDLVAAFGNQRSRLQTHIPYHTTPHARTH